MTDLTIERAEREALNDAMALDRAQREMHLTIGPDTIDRLRSSSVYTKERLRLAVADLWHVAVEEFNRWAHTIGRRK